MGKREAYNHSYNDQYQAGGARATNKMKKGSPCMQRFSINSTRRVWQLAVPSWEKQFCLKIGLFTWEDFLDAKQYSQFNGTNIQNWDDSAAKEAFNHAKTRFFTLFNGLHQRPDDDDQSVSDPDLYIDEINWDIDDEEVDPDLLCELELAKRPTDYVPDDDPRIWSIQDIKPTGWDVDIEEFSRPNVLTGLIVGS